MMGIIIFLGGNYCSTFKVNPFTYKPIFELVNTKKNYEFKEHCDKKSFCNHGNYNNMNKAKTYSPSMYNDNDEGVTTCLH